MISKKGNAMQKICMAVIVLSAVLLLAGCGDGSQKTNKKENEAKGREPGAVEIWDGAKADLENGLRVKKAVYVYTYSPFQYSITYDLGGRITSVTKSENAPLSAPVTLPDAFERVLNLDGALHYFGRGDTHTSDVEKRFYLYEEGEYNPDSRKLNQKSTYKNAKYEYSFSGNGTPLSYWYVDDDKQQSSEYEYDGKGRLIGETNYVNGEKFSTYVYVYENGKDLLLSKAKYGGSGYYYYQHSYDANGNVVKALTYRGEEWELCRISEWEYDEDGNLLLEKITEGERADSKDYYESSWITQYDETGHTIEGCRQISMGGKEYTVIKIEYLYDEKGRITEKNTYELLASKGWLDEQADWCNSGGNTELYITKKVEYKYGDTIMKNEISYEYEANKDFSQVNLTATKEDGWKEPRELMSEMEGYWIITYYTEEEVNQYLHDQEFSPVK